MINDGCLFTHTQKRFIHQNNTNNLNNGVSSDEWFLIKMSDVGFFILILFLIYNVNNTLKNHTIRIKIKANNFKHKEKF